MSRRKEDKRVLVVFEVLETFVVSPLTEAPVCLGGLPEDGDETSFVEASNRLPPLPRPAALPCSRGTTNKKRADSSALATRGGDKWTTTAFKKLWEGEFRVDRVTNPEADTIAFTVRLAESDEHIIPVKSAMNPVLVVLSVELSYQDDDGGPTVGVCYNFDNNEQFKCSMTENKRDSLVTRLWHRFIRSHGARLPWDLVYFALNPIFMDAYGSSKDQEDLLLDAAIMVVDIGLTTNRPSTQVVGRIIAIGDILETRGSFGLASQIHEQVALHYGRDRPDVAVIWSNAADASMHDADYVRAEEFSIKSLFYFEQRLGTEVNWDINEAHRWAMVFVLMSTYLDMAHWKEGNTDIQSFQNEKLLRVLSALLFVTRFDCKGNEILKFLVKDLGRQSRNSFKAHCRSAAGAKRVLKAATKHSDVENFRATLLACFRSDMAAIPLNWECSPALLVGDSQAESDAAREHFLESYPSAQGTATVGCQYRGCDVVERADNASPITTSQDDTTSPDGGVKFMWCPCKCVSYCSKECQEADWKYHKKVCVWQAKRKEKKKKTKDAHDSK